MPTLNLEVDYLAANTLQPDVVENEAKDIFDGAIAGIFTKAMTTNQNYTLDTSTGDPPYEWQNMVIKLTGSHTANVDLVVPNKEKLYIIVNECTGSVDVVIKTPTPTTTVNVTNGTTRIVYCDSANNIIPITAAL